MSGTDEEKSSTKSKKILVGCTGSVASIKIPLLVQELQKLDDTVYALILFDFYQMILCNWYVCVQFTLNTTETR